MLTVNEVGPGGQREGFRPHKTMTSNETYQAELDTRLAVSTVPPRTTSFIPSTTEEPPEPPIRGWTRYFSVSMSRTADESGGGSLRRKPDTTVDQLFSS